MQERTFPTTENKKARNKRGSLTQLTEDTANLT